jgi:hypothetical protein
MQLVTLPDLAAIKDHVQWQAQSGPKNLTPFHQV